MVTRYRAKVKESGKINIAEDEKINLPPRAVTVISGYIAKQKKLDAALLQAADRIRNEYLSGLEEKKQAAQENGLSSQMRAIENEMKAVGEDGSTFLEHFGSTVGS
jgi:hypothetical protein